MKKVLIKKLAFSKELIHITLSEVCMYRVTHKGGDFNTDLNTH